MEVLAGVRSYRIPLTKRMVHSYPQGFLLLNYVDFLSKGVHEFVLNTITSARLMFAQNWKKNITMKKEDWLEKLAMYLLM